ncbi:enoyl-CoA hydratase/isomerase family protein [Paractinoplanes globisporus]|uniref:Enoyl-CoA hydratase/isomerase family protein n=1 Tax=Paractinoplanes globisporus TaxID=113565 RepID=A0ABW6W8E9_9ACTN|nr:enoyl-CoA hydratase/isomerase family protein [Actinoplanes globisporus]
MAAVSTERDGDVLVVTLNRPESLNAINNDVLRGLKLAWQEAAAPEVRAVVVTGNGRGFCAGADLHGMGESDGPAGLEHSYNPHVTAMANLAKPVICAVNGPAAGAGLSLACTGDVRVAARSATFSPAFVRIGVVPDAGGTFLLTRLLGYSRAFDFLCSGRKIDAAEALAIGLVNEVVEDGEELHRALEKAHQMAAQPGIAVQLTKQLLRLAEQHGLADMLALEAQYQPQAVSHPDRTAARARVVEGLGRGTENNHAR